MRHPEFVRRFIALLRKETRQMLRDRSNLAVGLLLPVALILLFGYGLSFDVKNAPVAVVLEDSSPIAREAVAGLQGSSYLSPLWVANMDAAERLLRAGDADGIVRVPMDFSRRLAAGDARIQLILNGVNSTTAQTVEGYVNSAIATWAQKRADRAGMSDKFGRILVPTEEVVEMKGGQRKTTERRFFPGYVLVEMEMDDDSWHLVKHTNKVTGFIGGTGNRPTPISEKEVEKIMAQMQEGVEKPRPKTLFEVGEMVRVREGPFTDFNGNVEEVNYEKSRLRVSVTIFGRATPVELEFGQVEKV